MSMPAPPGSWTASPAPPPKKPKRWPWILGMVVTLFIGIGIGAAGTPEETTQTRAITPEASPATASPTASPQETPEPVEGFSLTKQDIELELKTTERQCFGSAGCSVTVQVRASLDAATADALPPEGQWDVTYQITGDESGPLIGTFSLYGNGKYDVNEEFLSTYSVNTPIRVKVTDVERFS
jgi:hypothetical protein